MIDSRLPIADSSDYLPPCPNCSLRSMPARSPGFWRARHSRGFTLDACCELSQGSPIVPSPDMPASGLITAEVRRDVLTKQKAARVALTNWWKMKRLTGKAEMLALFRERGLTAEMEATQ